MCQTSNNDNSYSISSYCSHCRISHINYDQLWQDTNKREQLIHNHCTKSSLDYQGSLRSLNVHQFCCHSSMRQCCRQGAEWRTNWIVASETNRKRRNPQMDVAAICSPRIEKGFTKDSPGVRWSKSIHDQGRLSLNFNLLLVVANCTMQHKTTV